MIIVELKVKAYVQEGFDVEHAVSEFLLDDDRVSFCDIDTVSEKGTSKTFPEDDEGEDYEDDNEEPQTERAKMEQWDIVDNAIFELIQRVKPTAETRIEWTTNGVAEARAEIRETLIRLFCGKLKLCTEDKFYP